MNLYAIQAAQNGLVNSTLHKGQIQISKMLVLSMAISCFDMSNIQRGPMQASLVISAPMRCQCFKMHVLTN
jgi:hypothetical protein